MDTESSPIVEQVAGLSNLRLRPDTDGLPCCKVPVSTRYGRTAPGLRRRHLRLTDEPTGVPGRGSTQRSSPIWTPIGRDQLASNTSARLLQINLLRRVRGHARRAASRAEAVIRAAGASPAITFRNQAVRLRAVSVTVSTCAWRATGTMSGPAV
jgi:hypothetical protein